ncbi:ABC transporter ATP-binding protein [Halalkalibacter urbisdiaboli]|uniref:ABC transporter ATP-binding protein n=1 Tax=Halalkalibacter urbisdiaboli TaxID=1960589 RepID=UPI000B43D700|nr:ABC transporter ATP-binding protein [Halalkalibacter urbisdiaboli]
MATPVLQTNKLSITNRKNNKQLLHGLDLTVHKGEMLGLVGESGSGKSLTASAIMGLLPKGLFINQGTIYVEGEEIQQLHPRQYQRLRGKKLGMIFQDYNGSLTPFYSIGKQMIETIRTHQSCSKQEANERVVEFLERVKLPAQRVFSSYPFELSGGQKQRVAIAMVMMLKPSLLIADEPTTALDVLTGERILDLIKELQSDLGCGVLFITHHISDVLKRADQVAVLYGGHRVEYGEMKRIKQHPKHPFTELLLQSQPSIGNQLERLPVIPGEPGQISTAGCPFVHRCPNRLERCNVEALRETVFAENHRACCHLYDQKESKGYVSEVN